nr:PREDICTED: uncharacterized protein LOC105667449 [Linepithema humile]
MVRDAEKGHLLSKFCIVFMYCGGLSYNTVMPFLSQAPEHEQNVTVRPMAYLGFDILFNLQLMPVYVFAFLLQCFTGVVMFNITTSVCCLAAMFVAHACGQINIVISRVKNLVKSEQNNNVKFEQGIAIIMQHHVRALRFSANIEDTLREICLVELVGTTLIMCLVEYSLMMCSKVGHTTYKIEWYKLPGKTALDLMLMITMSRYPIQITAGKLISLSFANFGNVLKTSLAYMNLLRTAI